MSISNIVATSHLSCSIDLFQVCEILENATYRPSRFKALTYRFPSGGCSRIFANGKLIVLGKKNKDSIVSSVADLAELIAGLGFPVNLQEIKVVNVVGTCSLERPVDLNQFYLLNREIATYNPEIFPAVNLKLNQSDFSSLLNRKSYYNGMSIC
jgi:TATA-box binding protein (TBP) (component of TFIID and TFIIIB)